MRRPSSPRWLPAPPRPGRGPTRPDSGPRRSSSRCSRGARRPRRRREGHAPLPGRQAVQGLAGRQSAPGHVAELDVDDVFAGDVVEIGRPAAAPPHVIGVHEETDVLVAGRRHRLANAREGIEPLAERVEFQGEADTVARRDVPTSATLAAARAASPRPRSTGLITVRHPRAVAHPHDSSKARRSRARSSPVANIQPSSTPTQAVARPERRTRLQHRLRRLSPLLGPGEIDAPQLHGVPARLARDLEHPRQRRGVERPRMEGERVGHAGQRASAAACRRTMAATCAKFSSPVAFSGEMSGGTTPHRASSQAHAADMRPLPDAILGKPSGANRSIIQGGAQRGTQMRHRSFEVSAWSAGPRSPCAGRPEAAAPGDHARPG